MDKKARHHRQTAVSTHNFIPPHERIHLINTEGEVTSSEKQIIFVPIFLNGIETRFLKKVDAKDKFIKNYETG